MPIAKLLQVLDCARCKGVRRGEKEEEVEVEVEEDSTEHVIFLIRLPDRSVK
jgi:hypothetical protein